MLVANAGGGRGRPNDTKASTLDPALLQLVVAMNLFGTVYSVNAIAPVKKEQRSGEGHHREFGRWRGTFGRRRLCHYGPQKEPSPLTRTSPLSDYVTAR